MCLPSMWSLLGAKGNICTMALKYIQQSMLHKHCIHIRCDHRLDRVHPTYIDSESHPTHNVYVGGLGKLPY